MRIAARLTAAVPFALALAGCGGPIHVGPDFLAMRASLEAEFQNGIYVCDAAGHGLRRVSGPLGTGEGVSEFHWSPDRTRIAFLKEATAGEHRDLYVVDPAAGMPALLAAGVGPDADAYAVEWSPDGTKLLLYGDLDGDGSASLYVLPAAGGAVVPVSDPGVLPGYSTWAWSPNSQRVAYTGGPGVNGPFALYAANADGTAITGVSGSMVAGGEVRFVQAGSPWCSDSIHLVFAADKLVDEQTELFVVEADGSNLVKVSKTLSTYEDVASFAFSPDGLHVAYTTYTSPSPAPLYVVPRAGGVSVPVSAAGEFVGTILWKPDSSGIVYRQSAENDALRLGNPAGGPSTLLFQTVGVAKNIEPHMIWSPDGTRLAFRAGIWGISDPDQWDLYVVDGAGATPAVLLSPQIADDGDVDDWFEWSPDGTRLVYSARDTTDDFREAFVVTADGLSVTQLSHAGDAGVWMNDVSFSTDGTGIAWQEGTDAGACEIFSAAPNGAQVRHVVDHTQPFAEVLYFLMK